MAARSVPDRTPSAIFHAVAYIGWMDLRWAVFILAACGSAPARPPEPPSNRTAGTGPLREQLIAELGPSAYLEASERGLLARRPFSDAHRVLVSGDVSAAAYDASLELALFVRRDDGRLYSFDLRAIAPEPAFVVEAAGDFAIGWFDGTSIASNAEAVSVSLDLRDGSVQWIRPGPPPTVNASWLAAMRPRTRRAAPAKIALAIGEVAMFGKTGLQVLAGEHDLALRDTSGRSASLHSPTDWYGPDKDTWYASCDVPDLDTTRTYWRVGSSICRRTGCDGEASLDVRYVGFLDIGAQVVPACAGDADPAE